MPERKIHFYNLNIIDISKGECANDKAKDLLDSIIEKYFNEKEYTDHQINPDKKIPIKTGSITIEGKKNNIDVIENNTRIFFARTVKDKDIHDLALRQNNSNEMRSVLPQGSDDDVVIYTHFFIDYTKMIMGFVLGRGATKHDILCKLFDHYYPKEYQIEIKDIMAEKTVKALKKPGSKINGATLRYSSPSASLLEDLKFGTQTMLDMDNNDEYEIVVSIRNKAKKGGFLFNQPNKIKTFISEVEDLLAKKKKGLWNLDSALLNGKTPGETKQEKYYFSSSEYTKSISFSTTYKDGNIKRVLQPDQITSFLNREILKKYEDNKKYILPLAGK